MSTLKEAERELELRCLLEETLGFLAIMTYMNAQNIHINKRLNARNLIIRIQRAIGQPVRPVFTDEFMESVIKEVRDIDIDEQKK